MDTTTTSEIVHKSHRELEALGFSAIIAAALDPSSIVIFASGTHGGGGSGTLVKYKGILGILTASHVAASLNDCKVYLPYRLRANTDDIWEITPVPFCRILLIDDLSLYSNKLWSESGLDIALIQLEDDIFDSILDHTKKIPIDLNEMKNRYTSELHKYWSSEKTNDWSWVMAGRPREGFKKLESTEPNLQNVLYFPAPGVYIGGGVCRIRRNTLDKVDSKYKGHDADLIESLIDTSDILPNDFAGMSGGGCFQVKGRLHNNEYIVDEFILAGVFVAASIDGDYLVSRGHISVYEVFSLYLDDQIGNIPEIISTA